MTLEESRMLIDGKLVPAAGGRTYDNVNPATEAVLGPVTDATAEDMATAIAGARQAFDSTPWATDHAFRKEGAHFQALGGVEVLSDIARAEIHDVVAVSPADGRPAVRSVDASSATITS